jgi:hypothetical protein
MQEDNQTIIERLSGQITEVRNETEEIRKENETFVHETLERKI